MIKLPKMKGFTFLETIITITIVSIIFATGSLLVAQSTTNYYAEKDLAIGSSKINIQINRLTNYLSPIFKNIYMPLYLSPSNDEIIIAIATTGFSQDLVADKTYISQIVKITKDGSEIKLSTYLPANIGADTLYDSSEDFSTLTAGATFTSIESTTVIGSNITSFGAYYFDVLQATTTVTDDIANVVIDASFQVDTVTQSRSIVISPWRLFL